MKKVLLLCSFLMMFQFSEAQSSRKDFIKNYLDKAVELLESHGQVYEGYASVDKSNMLDAVELVKQELIFKEVMEDPLVYNFVMGVGSLKPSRMYWFKKHQCYEEISEFRITDTYWYRFKNEDPDKEMRLRILVQSIETENDCGLKGSEIVSFELFDAYGNNLGFEMEVIIPEGPLLDRS